MTWAVTLDFHNTLARCDEWFNLEVYDLVPAFFEWRRTTTGGVLDEHATRTGQQHYRKLRRRVIDTGIELDAASAIAEVVDHLGLDIQAAEISQAMADIFKPTLQFAEPLPGVVDAVKCLRSAAVPLAVVSSAAYHPFLEWTLRKFELADCFDEIITSASTGHYKSSTRIYESALDALAVEPGYCVHIGDSERFDVVPAKKLGMRTVLVSPDARSSLADLCLPTLEGLPRALNREFGLPLAL